MGGRAVEGTGLENQQARECLVGSNPTPSASAHCFRGYLQLLVSCPPNCPTLIGRLKRVFSERAATSCHTRDPRRTLVMLGATHPRLMP